MQPPHSGAPDIVSGTRNLTPLSIGIITNSQTRLFVGKNTPPPELGTSGDYYFRTDTPSTNQQRIYVRDELGWIGII